MTAAPTFSNLTSDGAPTATSFTTASVSPSGNQLILVSVHAYISTGSTAPSAPAVTGNGITYDLLHTQNVDTAGADRATVFVYIGMAASPSPGAVTIDFGATAMTRCVWVVDQSDANVLTTGTNGADAVLQHVGTTSASVSSQSISYSQTLPGTSTMYAVFAHQTNVATTPRASWTEVTDATPVTLASLETQYFTGSDTAASATWGTAARTGGVVLEITPVAPALRSTTKLTGTSGTSAAVPVPAGATSGDIAVIGLYLETAATVTPPSGFTNKADLSTNTGSQGRLAVYWKRLTGADSGTYSFSWTGSAWRAAVAGLWSGRATSGDPFDDFGTAESVAGVTTLNVSASPAAAGGAGIGIWTNFSTSTSFTPPTNYTEQQDDPAICLDTRESLASGSTGSVTATASTTDFMKGFLGVLAADTGAAFTGTAAATQDDQTSVASGQLQHTGTTAVTQDDQTSTGSGTVANAVTGTAAVTQDDQAPSATGQLQHVGTAAATQADQTSTTSGLVGVIGSVAASQDDQTSSAAGSLTFTGTVSATQDDQVGAASGSTLTGISGSAAVAQDDQTATASGAAGLVGSAAATQADQASSATGTLTYTGTAATTQDDQTATASGTALSGISGSAAATQADQTSAATGQLQHTGTSAVTQDDQTSAATGAVTGAVTGTAAAAQDSQTSTASGLAGYIGSAVVSQDSHTAAATGTVAAAVTGTVSVTQDSQTSNASGTALLAILGAVAITQDDQTATATGMNLAAITYRPNTGATGRPGSGRTSRPFTGVTPRP